MPDGPCEYNGRKLHLPPDPGLGQDHALVRAERAEGHLERRHDLTALVPSQDQPGHLPLPRGKVKFIEDVVNGRQADHGALRRTGTI